MPMVKVRRRRTPHMFVNTGLPLPAPAYRKGHNIGVTPFIVAIVFLAIGVLGTIGWALGIGYRGGSFHPVGWIRDMIKAFQMF
jgi:hypothetical protein